MGQFRRAAGEETHELQAQTLLRLFPAPPAAPAASPDTKHQER